MCACCPNKEFSRTLSLPLAASLCLLSQKHSRSYQAQLEVGTLSLCLSKPQALPPGNKRLGQEQCVSC